MKLSDSLKFASLKSLQLSDSLKSLIIINRFPAKVEILHLILAKKKTSISYLISWYINTATCIHTIYRHLLALFHVSLEKQSIDFLLFRLIITAVSHI